MESSDARAYINRWQAVEKIERKELQSTSLNSLNKNNESMDSIQYTERFVKSYEEGPTFSTVSGSSQQIE